MRGQAIWLYGLPGAGKSTLAAALEARLGSLGFTIVVLDGDAMRAGLNRDLGFDEAARTENLRRAAEVTKLLVRAGIVTICAFITPFATQRQLVRAIIGEGYLLEVYLTASLADCSRRDPKGLYAQARAGEVRQFTGVDSRFEPPDSSEHPVLIASGRVGVEECLAQLLEHVLPRLGAPR